MSRRRREAHEDLGPCCQCNRIGRSVRNIVMYDLRAPVPGTGWGCVVCHKPQDGAIAVLCDRCLDTPGVPTRPATVCAGNPKDGRRVPFAALPPEPFTHDMRYHPEVDAGRVCRACGCTDDDCRGCVERTGEPCHWVEEDLCSACMEEGL